MGYYYMTRESALSTKVPYNSLFTINEEYEVEHHSSTTHRSLEMTSSYYLNMLVVGRNAKCAHGIFPMLLHYNNSNG